MAFPNCGECGHPADWHRLDSDLNIGPTDPEVTFGCIGYDCTTDGPIGFCSWGCPDYQEQGRLSDLRETHPRPVVPDAPS